MFELVNLHILVVKGKRFRGQKRPRQDTPSNVKNGGTKPAPRGQHKRFDDDDDEKMKETGKKDVSATADGDEPKTKQAKAE